MYGIIFLLIALLLVPVLVYPSSYTTVLVSFKEGKYDPDIVGASGGRIIDEFRTMGMLYAIVPSRVLSSLAQNPALEFVESDSQFEVAEANTSEYSQSWALQDIGVEPAHSSNYSG